MTKGPFLDKVEKKARDIGINFKNKDEIKRYYKELVDGWSKKNRQSGLKESTRGSENQEAILYGWLKKEADSRFDGLVKEDNDKYIADSKKIFKNETFNKLSSFKVDSEYENSTFNIVLNDLKEVLSTRLDSISLSDIKSGGSLKFDESEVQDLFDNRIFNRVQEFRRSFRDSNDLNGLERLKEDVSNTRYSSDMIKDIDSDIIRLKKDS